MNGSDFIPVRPVVLAQWHIKAINECGEVVHEEKKENLIVKTGRADVLQLLFDLSGVALNAMGAGACSTAATVDDTRLNYEHILNPTRKDLTNTDGDPLDVADIVDETYTDGLGNTYYKKLVLQATYAAGDLNNGHPFQEYGLFSTATLPGTPTGTSGVMFNHLVAASPISKDATITLLVIVTLRV